MRRYRFENDDAVDGDMAINSLYTPRPEAHSRLSKHEAVPPMPFWVFLAFVIFSVAVIFIAFHEMHPEVEPLSQSLAAQFYARTPKEIDPDSPVIVLGSGLSGACCQSLWEVLIVAFGLILHSIFAIRIVECQTDPAQRDSSHSRRIR